MNLWLDDEREPPDGWIWAKTAEEAIEELRTGYVTEVSLDHDLGMNENGTGYDVLCYIEEFVKPLPLIHIHTANASARVKMEVAVRRMRERNETN